MQECAERSPDLCGEQGCAGVSREAPGDVLGGRVCGSVQGGVRSFSGMKGVKGCPGRCPGFCWEEGCEGVHGEVSRVSRGGRVWRSMQGDVWGFAGRKGMRE